jgi:hypothetical protein
MNYLKLSTEEIIINFAKEYSFEIFPYFSHISYESGIKYWKEELSKYETLDKETAYHKVKEDILSSINYYENYLKEEENKLKILKEKYDSINKIIFPKKFNKMKKLLLKDIKEEIMKNKISRYNDWLNHYKKSYVELSFEKFLKEEEENILKIQKDLKECETKHNEIQKNKEKRENVIIELEDFLKNYGEIK